MHRSPMHRSNSSDIHPFAWQIVAALEDGKMCVSNIKPLVDAVNAFAVEEALPGRMVYVSNE